MLSRLAAAALGDPLLATGAAPAVRPDALPAPVFARGGPDAVLYGVNDGYPVPDKALAVRTGNPWPARFRVGAFTHLDAIYPTRLVERASAPSHFERSTADVQYSFRGRSTSWGDYLERQPVTGLLVAKNDCILFEHYQYGRTDADRLLGQSMTKSIVGLLVGLAIADGAIRSVDDTPETYVPGFKGSEYGRTPIRDLLHMSSGVDFGEARNDGQDLNRLWKDLVLGGGLFRKGSIDSIRQFDRRIAPPGTRFHYASIEPDVLAMVLHHVLDRPLSQYLRDRLWQPIGAEADATWLTDAEGIEVAHFGYSAVLRDYARLGRLLAMDGAWEGRQLIPDGWIRESTSVRTGDDHLAPGKATPRLGYGHLLWLLPGERRQFALLGQNGQRICVDPGAQIVMVHTALEDNDEFWALWSAVVAQLA